MLGFKRFRHATIAIAGVELVHRIRKGQFALSKFRDTGATVIRRATNMFGEAEVRTSA